ncbi:uncharacterized protein LOC106052597 [Biomphalaria glabrata]|uniref:Uncharacterized protein LOC106052597 n=1 Tax=Biomphalaria glabrata TaxID=6526 RepID=A0A9W2YWK5_BIOGL|nr:uncharacterized protein LOC106052597 [Biomphalaria glabrata]
MAESFRGIDNSIDACNGEEINISIWNIIPVIVILFPTSTEGCDTQGEINVTLSNITLKENRDYLIENETLLTKGFIYIANYDINAIKATCKILNGNTKETLEEMDALFIKDCATTQKDSQFYCIRNGSNFDVILNITAKIVFNNTIMSLELRIRDTNCIKHSNLITVPKIRKSSENISTTQATTQATGSSEYIDSPWWSIFLTTVLALQTTLRPFSVIG